MLKELCLSYDTKTSEVEQAKETYEKLLAERSEIVKAIAGVISPKKKFIRAGREVTIVQRNQTFFFRGSKSETGLEEID